MKKLTFFLIILTTISLISCSTEKNSSSPQTNINSESSSNVEKNTFTSSNTGWHKTAGETTEDDWLKMTDYQKEDIVNAMINSVEKSGSKVVKDSKWFISNLNDFYKDGGTNTNLAQAFSMILVAGGGTEEQQKKIESKTKNLTATEEAIWKYCNDRWEYYDRLEGRYSGDKYTEQVFKDAGNKFGISADEAERIWTKADRAKLGL